MKRRNFNKLAGAMASTPLLLNSIPLRSFASAQLAASLDCSSLQERSIVVIRMAGANDGINTVIPVGKYDRYSQLRPSLRIRESDYLPLSGPTGIDEIALHPNLTGFRGLYDNGQMNIIQGVSYPSSNRSHFKSTDLMLTGGDGLPENFNLQEGWMARFLESRYPEALNGPIPSLPDPLGLQLGGSRLSLGFHTDEEHDVAFNLAGQDPGSIFGVFSGLGGPPPMTIPNSEYGAEIDYLIDQQNSISVFAERISGVYNAGSNMTAYPQSDLSQQLATVARLMNGGARTKVYLVEITGFDTHAEQVVAGSPTVGRHADLLKELSEAVDAFYKDLDQMGMSDKVMTVTFSEFGRKAEENANYGTDHGTVGPMFVFGPGARGGVTGSNVNLDQLDSGAPATYEHDYRTVFGSLLLDWLGADDNAMTKTGFLPYLGDSKLDLVQANLVADVGAAFCQDSTTIGEVQKLTMSQANAESWQRVDFIKPYVSPIVVMSPVSYNNSDGAMMRIRNVDSTGFECQISKWENLSSAHPEEEINVLVIEEGAHSLPNGQRVMAGRSGVNPRFRYVNFPEVFAVPPVVLTQLASDREMDPTIIRQTRITEKDFTVKLRESQGADKRHVEEEVHYIAIEPGSDDGQVKFEAAKTGGGITHEWKSLEFEQSYGLSPVFLASIQSHGNGDTVKLRYAELSRTGVDIVLQEETTVDEEIRHPQEDVGYVVFDGPGVIAGGEYVAPEEDPEEEPAEPTDVSVLAFPNPFSTKLQIQVKDAVGAQARIKLLSGDGSRLYLSVMMSTQATMNLSTTSLPVGVYILNVEVDGAMLSETLIKEM